MLQYICEVCHKVKPENQEWILGFDVQVEGERVMKRSLVFADAWEDERAIEWTAIHICSDACKQKYMKLTRAA
jgi:hypothetical protein